MTTIIGSLKRQPSTDSGTFGRLTLKNGSSSQGLLWTELSWPSGELPWRNDTPDISCVPVGSYVCKLQPSPHFAARYPGGLYHLQDVPGRELCMIHPANWMGDVSKGLKCQLEGCIALGKEQGEIAGQQGIISSTVAIQEFMAALGGQDFLLTIC